MSDFFTRLAERTLGLAPTIQPVMPSLFAPVSDVPGDMLLEISEEREEGVVAGNFSGNVESPVPAQDAATQLTYPDQPAQLTHAASMQVQRAVSQPFSTTAPAPTRQQSHPALATMAERQATRMADSLITRNETSTTGTKVQPTRRGSQRTRPVTSAVPAVPAIPTPSAYTQTPSFAPMNAQTVRMARRTDEITETIATLPTSSITDDLFTHISTAQTASEQQLVQAQRTTRAATLHEQIVSHHTLVGVPAPNPPSTTGFLQAQQIHQTQQTQQTQQTPLAQLETPSLEPDIQVTIGRVEVRAVTAPPTSTRTQQQSDRPPAMSLDEYLRQQERGGGRR